MRSTCCQTRSTMRACSLITSSEDDPTHRNCSKAASSENFSHGHLAAPPPSPTSTRPESVLVNKDSQQKNLEALEAVNEIPKMVSVVASNVTSQSLSKLRSLGI